MNYLKAEMLKYKSSFANKILVIAPICTGLFAWVVGGFTGYQYMTLYWWYAFLLPGTIAILCYLANQKEERADKYFSVFSMPIHLKKFWFYKNLVLIEKILVGALILSLMICISNVIAPATTVYTPSQVFIGSILISYASIWQLPLCLFLAKKIGMFGTIFINTLLGIFLPPLAGSTDIWFLFPHCWSAKLSETLMGIEINGTLMPHLNISLNIVLIVLVLTSILFIVLSAFSATWFSKQEG